MKRSIIKTLTLPIVVLLSILSSGPAAAATDETSAPAASGADGFSLLRQAASAIDAYDLVEAERLALLAVERTVAENGGDTHPAVATALVGLGRTLFRMERYAEAATHFARAQSILDRTIGAQAPIAPVLAEMRLECWHRAARPEEALGAAQDLLTRLQAQSAPDEARGLAATRRLGESLLALNRLDEAEPPLRKAMEQARRLHGEAHPAFASIQEKLEEIRRRRGEVVVPLFVGSWGSPQRLTFEGNESFPAEELRRSLLSHPPTFAATHPTTRLADYLVQVQSALLSGYRAAGFRDASVSVVAAAPAGMLQVRITEGKRFRCGLVHLVGLREIDPAVLMKSLTVDAGQGAGTDDLKPIDDALAKIYASREGSPTPFPATTSTQPVIVDEVVGLNIGTSGAPADAAEKEKAKVTANIGEQQKLVIPYSGNLEPAWLAGEPAAFTETAEAGLKNQLRAHLYNLGRPRARFETETAIDEAAGTVDLTVRMLDEGPPSVVGAVTVTGTVKNSPQEIIDFLGLHAGTPLRRETLREAKRKLWNCGRFRHFSLTATALGRDRPEIDVAVEVIELEFAPPVRTPLDPELETLLLCARHLSTPAAWGGDLVLEFKAGPPTRKNAPSPAGFLAACSPDGRAAVRIPAAETGQPPTLMALHDRTLDLSIGRKGFPFFWRTTMPDVGTAILQLQMLVSPTPGKSGFFYVGAGFSSEDTGAAIRPDILLAPSSILAWAMDKKPRLSRKKGEYIIETPERGRIRFDSKSGRLIEWVSVSLESGTLVARFQSGAVKKLAAQAAAARARTPESQQIEATPIASFGLAAWIALHQFGATQPAEQSSVDDFDLSSLLPTDASGLEALRAGLGIVRTLDKVLGRVGGALASPRKPSLPNSPEDPAFFVPVDPAHVLQGNSLVAWLVPGLFAIADRNLPPESWLTAFSREVAYLASGRSQSSDSVFAEMLTDSTLGPLGCLLAAKVLHRLQHPAAADFLRRATSLTRKEDFRRDWRLLTDSDWFGRDALRSALDELARLTPREMEGIASLLPENLADWPARLIVTLQEKQGLPLAEVVGPSMDELWDSFLAAKVRQVALRSLEPPEPAADPAQVAATVNGLPITRKEVAFASTVAGHYFPHLARYTRRDGAIALTAAAQATDTLVLAQLAHHFFRANKGTIDESQQEQAYQQTIAQVTGGDEAAFLDLVSMTRDEFMALLQLKNVSLFLTQQIAASVPAPSEAEVAAAAPVWRRHHSVRRHLHGLSLMPETTLAKRVHWADAIATLVAEGLPFELLVKASSGPLAGSLIQGACLGEDAGKSLTGPYADAVEALAPGQVTAPLVTHSDALIFLALQGASEESDDGPSPDPAALPAWVLSQKQSAAVGEFFAKARAAARIRILKQPPGENPSSLLTAPLQELADRASFSAVPQLALLFSHLRENDAPAADKAFEQLEFLDLPGEAWKILGTTLLERREPALAERAARSALRLDPADAPAQAQLEKAVAARDSQTSSDPGEPAVSPPASRPNPGALTPTRVLQADPPLSLLDITSLQDDLLPVSAHWRTPSPPSDPERPSPPRTH